MYTDIKNVQILIAALKAYNVSNIVISPGGSDIPIVHSIENDKYFKCYSVVDERSAVYFGIGVSQIIQAPVACICTSGTAATNYLPGITEAYYRNVQIIAITADKNPIFQGQIETQKIDQSDIFINVTKKAVNLLPSIRTEDDSWYCERLIKEALLASSHHGKGPVHINIPIIGSYSNFNTKDLPSITPIKVISCEDSKLTWNKYVELLNHSRKILVVVGQDITFTNEDVRLIESFFRIYNCMFSVEHSSNLSCDGTLFTYAVTETGNALSQDLVPDMVISFGNNVVSYGLKPFLRAYAKKFRHLAIDPGGRVRDVFQSLTDVFECSHTSFFSNFVMNAPAGANNNKEYYNSWLNSILKIKIVDFPFSDLYVAQKLAPIIPENSILHLAILSSVRIMQFFNLAKNIRVFVNAGALGIDGCLSTLIGHAAVSEVLTIGVIGDLSFFYDMNAAGIKHINRNLRIILLNNGGGSEFHFFNSIEVIPTINEHICAKHSKSAKGWVQSLGYMYYSATNEIELDNAFESFFQLSDSPKFIEIFTNMEDDAKVIRDFYNINRPPKSFIKESKVILSKIKKRIN